MARLAIPSPRLFVNEKLPCGIAFGQKCVDFNVDHGVADLKRIFFFHDHIPSSDGGHLNGVGFGDGTNGSNGFDTGNVSHGASLYFISPFHGSAVG